MRELDFNQRVIFVITIIFGIILHIYNLDQLSGWTDEYASMYFAENLNEVYSTETHPPLFYAVLKPFVWIFGKNLQALRVCVGLMSFALLVWAISLSKRIFGIKGAVLMAVLLILNPVEIIHARMVRHYSIFFELTVIMILYSLIERKEVMVTVIGLALIWIHPIGFIPVFAVLVLELLKNKKMTRLIAALSMSVATIVIYFGSKYLFLEKGKHLTGYNSGPRNYNFYASILKNMAGEHFPKANYYPPTLLFLLFLSFVLIGLLIYGFKRPVSKSWWILITFLAVSLITTEVINLVVVNIRYGRYFTYLLAPFIIFAVDKCHLKKHSIPIAFGLGLFCLFNVNPFQLYPGEREVIGQLHGEGSALLCANEFQFYYHLNSPEIECRDQYKVLRNGKMDFHFVDMSGFGVEMLNEINQHYEIVDFRRIGNMSVARAIYRK